jgi:hypothetical protein
MKMDLLVTKYFIKFFLFLLFFLPKIKNFFKSSHITLHLKAYIAIEFHISFQISKMMLF